MPLLNPHPPRNTMSVEQRMNDFYAWAQQLQADMRQLHAAHETEVRNLSQRVGFLENVLRDHFHFVPPPIDDSDLMRRLQRLRNDV